MTSERRKQTKGRQKIEMKQIENEDDKLVTFSKRRAGIYKKASELATLTGAEIGFVVFSPANKAFSFAHPSMESIANRFLGKEPIINQHNTHLHVLAQRQLRIEELNQLHNELLQQLEDTKQKEKELKQKMRGVERNGWWDTSIEELNVQEMIQLESNFKEVHQNLTNKLKEKIESCNIGISSSLVPPPPPSDPNSTPTFNP